MNITGQSVRSTLRSYQSPSLNKLAARESGVIEPETPDQANASLKKVGNLLQMLDSYSRQRVTDDQNQSAANTTESGPLLVGGVNNKLGVAAISLAAVKTAIDTDSSGIVAAEVAIATDSAGIEAVNSAMKQNLTQLASDPEAFHHAMNSSFGESYDQSEAEAIRNQVLNSDFSWMPDIKIVDASMLQNQSGMQGEGLGAYSKHNDTIYISGQLLQSDPDKAVHVLTEELGHGLDARLNSADAAGDEGDIFARVVAGEKISDVDLSHLKVENDNGVILVDGNEVEVEFASIWTRARRELSRAKDRGKKELDRVGRRIDKNILRPIWDAGKFAVRGFKTLAKGAVRMPFDLLTDTSQGFGKTLAMVFEGDWKGAGKKIRKIITNSHTFPIRSGLETRGIILHTIVGAWDILRGDLTIRGLDARETEYLQDIYGTSINYSKVRIHHGGSKEQLSARANVVGNDIFMPLEDDNSIAMFNADGTMTDEGLTLLGHEAAHVWQYQDDGTRYIGESLLGQLNNKLLKGSDPYSWRSDVASGVEFKNLGPEQQAEVAELIGEALALNRVANPGAPAAILTRDELNQALGYIPPTAANPAPSAIEALTDVEFDIIERAFEYINR